MECRIFQADSYFTSARVISFKHIVSDLIPSKIIPIQSPLDSYPYAATLFGQLPTWTTTPSNTIP